LICFGLGFVKDYYIAVALRYVGVSDFPTKTFFWCTNTNWTFASLPQPLLHLRDVYDKIDVYFSGEFDRVVIDSHGKSELVHIDNKSLELSAKGVTELDRLAYVVYAIDNDCSIVPVMSFKMTPIKEVRRNEAFRGLKKDAVFQFENYAHFRKPLTKDKKEQLERDEAIYNHKFLDEITSDLPKGSWNLLKDTSDSVAVLRNTLWPGYYAYHRCNTPIFGGVYMGNGIKNLDLPFML
jgi:radial spoke head protein 9